jgi:antitoxin (DNA-binding transcriptional repressor) of toxin-antitoxin stability system
MARDSDGRDNNSLCYSCRMHEFTLTEAQKKLPELVDEALNGEDILIKKDDHAAVKLTAVMKSGRRQFGSAKGLIEFATDFDDPLPEFEPYS